jgi:CBS domain-containing protein
MHDEPVTIHPDATVRDAATVMHDRDVSRLPVVDRDGKLVGIVGRGDVLRYLVGGEGE